MIKTVNLACTISPEHIKCPGPFKKMSGHVHMTNCYADIFGPCPLDMSMYNTGNYDNAERSRQTFTVTFTRSFYQIYSTFYPNLLIRLLSTT